MTAFLNWWMGGLPKIHYRDQINSFKKYLLHPINRWLAKYYLPILQKFTDVKVVAVTGSAGKTTTKEMIASILATSGKTIYSKENIDPVYNIPSTILRTPPGTKYLVLEMGVEYPGEMDFYLWLAKPDVGVITNIFPTHTEFLEDIEGVLKEKGELIKGLDDKGIAVLNADDRLLKDFAKGLKIKILWFKDDVNPFIANANAAKVVAEIFNISDTNIRKGLSRYKNPPHRLEVITHPSGAVILDDSYNSNPWAAVATLKYFNKLAKGRKVAVLGDMLELGTYNEEGHRLLGREVARSGFDSVIGIGKSSEFLIEEISKEAGSVKTFIFSEAIKALPTVKTFLNKNTFILIKGSRSMGLDKIVEGIS